MTECVQSEVELVQLLKLGTGAEAGNVKIVPMRGNAGADVAEDGAAVMVLLLRCAIREGLGISHLNVELHPIRGLVHVATGTLRRQQTTSVRRAPREAAQASAR